jgi:hypothetical protein
MNDLSRAAREAGRKKRLGAALRDNLKRRKAQARGRSAAPVDRWKSPHDSAGIGADKRNG